MALDSPPTRRRALLTLGASLPAFAAARLAFASPAARVEVAAVTRIPRAVGAADLAMAAADAEASELLGALRRGSHLGASRVIEVGPVRHGSIALSMASSGGRPFQLDVLRDDGRGGAVGRAPGLAIYVSNEGDGGTPTDEEQGLAAMALARLLRRRVREGARVPAMLTLVEREQRFPRGLFRA